MKKTRLRVVFLVLVVFLALLAAPAPAATILTATPPPGVTLNFFSLAGINFGVDVRSTSVLTDPLLQSAYLTDLGAPGSPNLTQYAVNLGGTEFLGVTFNPASLLLSPDFLIAVITGTASQISLNITDPVLLSMLLSGGIGEYVFTFAQATDLGAGISFLTYDLDYAKVAVPEPATCSLAALGLGIGALALLRKRH